MNRIDIPDDTRSLHKIGEAVMAYEARQNAFLNALVNRIAYTIVTSKRWQDPWAIFNQGRMDLGETVEEIFVNVAKPHSYDPAVAEKEIFKRENPDVRAAFHTMNYQKFYKVSVSEEQLRAAFISWSGLTELVNYIVESLYNGMALDEWLVKKYMVSRGLLNGDFYAVTHKDLATAPGDAITKYRQLTNDMLLYKTKFNRAGVRTFTPINDQIIIVPNDVEAQLGVDVLASAFNLNQVDYIGNRLPVDSFEFDAADVERLGELFEDDDTYKPFTGDEIAKLQKVSAIKIDRKWMMNFDNLETMRQDQNGQGLYHLWWLHAWRTFSTSPFANAVAFTTEATEITEVAVTPATANVTQGADLVLTAKVTGTGLFEKSVTWSIKGNTSEGTSINPVSGQLHVAKDEKATNKITVTATAVDGQTGTATITCTAA